MIGAQAQVGAINSTLSFKLQLQASSLRLLLSQPPGFQLCLAL
jgi:hypothetical protein